MRAYVLRRLLLGLVIIWGVYTLTFFAVNLAPGDPFAKLENPKMKKADLDRLRHKWGYDQPVLVRYGIQIRKMFWADRETSFYESDGLAFEISALGDGNGLRARLQTPPDVVNVVPDEESHLAGVKGVALARDTGNRNSAPSAHGTHFFGEGKLLVRDDGSSAPLVTQGLTLEAAAGRLEARRTRDAAPEVLQLDHDAGTVVVPPNDDGTFGPVALAPDRYRHGAADIVVPQDRLHPGGPTLDLGTSISYRRPVASYLLHPLLNILLLAAAALLVDFAIGIVIGVI